MASDARLIAARYVQALFELATERNEHDSVKADLLVLGSGFNGNGEFEKWLTNPVIGREASVQVIGNILTAMKACDLTQKFFAQLARQRRLALTPLVIEQYLERLAESRGELTVRVTSAAALSEEEKKILSGTLAKATGKKVEIKSDENPELLGGLKIRVGSKMLDNSVAGKLARLKQSLTRAA